MKNVSYAVAIAGVNLLALGMSNGDATTLKPYFGSALEPTQTQSMSSAQMRIVEASHLEVYAACKWGHAAFDPVKIDSEPLSIQVRSIYENMG